MIWLFIGAIILLIVGWYLLRSANSEILLEATISTTDALTYKLYFKSHQTNLNPAEYVRLILCFGAKMLHIIDPNDPNQTHVKNEILESLKKLSETELSQNTDIMSVCDQDNFIKSSVGAPKPKDKKIVATLYFLDSMQRGITTSLPVKWYEYQFLHSWLALIQESLPKLDDFLIDHLQKSLKQMAELYFEEGIDYSTIDALNNVPNIAFVAAANE